ncbi:DUF11 domain-containing protein [Amycolatopsis anabasis]|uniref:DUF11 domain-containing protein n=1 Tax=Amycolatopsis anabasis TaxID=1840409 RepID=UPI00131C27B0|nr:DUF11 domain-containing protein [Amycolatopsis anabasis]
MARSSFLRRGATLAGVLLVTGLAVAAPARADTPEVALSVAPATVNTGETVTVTETITNLTGGSILNPTARLLSKPSVLTSYASLVSCGGAGVASCATLDGPDGPIGYQAILAEAMSNLESRTVTFTLRINPDAGERTEILQGQLWGRNYGTFPVDGPALTVHARADAAVGLTAAPKFGLLVSRLDFTAKITNNGPGTLRDAVFTTNLPAGLTATSNTPACVPGAGKVVCSVAGLANGANTALGFSVRLNLLSLGVPYTFTTTRTASASVDPDPANDSASTSCTVVTPLLVNCG